MFLTAHAAIAAAISTAAGTGPAGAFAVGVISHFVADIVPHGDERVGEWALRGDPARRFAFAAAIDGSFLTVFLLAVFFRTGWSWTTVSAAAGAVLPDALWGAGLVLKREIIPGYLRFHQRLHHLVPFRLPLWAGLFLQLAITVLGSICLTA